MSNTLLLFGHHFITYTHTNNKFIVMIILTLLLVSLCDGAFHNSHMNKLLCTNKIHCLAVRTALSTTVTTTTTLSAVPKSNRENEIRRKIIQLKKEGKIGGGTKQNSNEAAAEGDDTSTNYMLEQLRRSREKEGKSSQVTQQYQEKILFNHKNKNKLPAPEEDDEDEEDSNTASNIVADEEDELLERVAQKWEEKIGGGTSTKNMEDVHFVKDVEEKERELNQLYGYSENASNTTTTTTATTTNTKTTTGVGGNWKNENGTLGEIYKPSRGSWGAFPRPKDISKAYGGGKRVDPLQLEENLKNSGIGSGLDETRDKLRAYREKVGIVVESELEHADQIEEALTISNRAMQRGVYAAAVSVLEKVTPFCSTNSKTGGKVFLELAMAYEAVGRTDEAIAVYSKLTSSRIEDIKYDAKRLLYGIEAMQFMRNEVRDSSFSRKKVTQEFIDLTGFNNMAEKFDNAYATAYVDMDKANYYQRLSESVVRSYREARLVLLTGNVDRLRIVQALRYMNSDFESALRAEKAASEEVTKKGEDVFVPLMNGVPIVVKVKNNNDGTTSASSFADTMDKFRLGSPDQMLNNMNGEWKLQLIADKSGDGVKFFNSTVAWQKIDTTCMEYNYFIPAPMMLMSAKRAGSLTFDGETRTLERKISSSSFFSFPTPSAAATAIQIICVDSELCVTRIAGKKLVDDSNVKEYFAVWKCVEPGTFVK